MSEIKDLSRENAASKLKELAENIKTCMFCTNLSKEPASVRPMGISKVDELGNLWFLSNAESHKNDEIKNNDTVQLIFADPSSSKFMTVYGEADILKDQVSVDEAWTPIAKAWFTEGKDDANLTVIKVHPSIAYYWDTQNGKMITLLKIAAAAISGKPMDGAVEGKLTVDKIQKD
ncbi:MAG: pyridoxamine 5'-phosphate oxidase family protein [Ferruginibacter sp.]